MSREHLHMAVGDSAPVFLIRLKPGGDAPAGPVDLTAATATYSVRNRKTKASVFSGRTATVASGVYQVNGVAKTIVPSDGYLICTFETGDTATAGAFEFRTRVTFPTGRIASFPNSGWMPLTISE